MLLYRWLKNYNENIKQTFCFFLKWHNGKLWPTGINAGWLLTQLQQYNSVESWVRFPPVVSGGIFTEQESITTIHESQCRLCKAERFVHWPLKLFLSSGIPQEWWIYQLVACPHLLKALFLALCPSHTLSRPLSRILRMPRPQDKTQSSHQRATESNIQMTNCSQLNPPNISTRIHACIHTDIHTHMPACVV